MKEIKRSLMENPKVISHVNSSVDCGISDEINEEVKMNVLEQMLKHFWLTLCRLFHLKQKCYSNIQNKGLLKGIKNTTSKPFID